MKQLLEKKAVERVLIKAMMDKYNLNELDAKCKYFSLNRKERRRMVKEASRRIRYLMKNPDQLKRAQKVKDAD